MLFADYQWLMAICVLGICFLLAIVIRTSLRHKARARLQGNSLSLRERSSSVHN
jgi:hypothetical protein